MMSYFIYTIEYAYNLQQMYLNSQEYTKLENRDMLGTFLAYKIGTIMGYSQDNVKYPWDIPEYREFRPVGYHSRYFQDILGCVQDITR